MTPENTRLALVAAAVALVLAIPILGRSFGGAPTTIGDVVEGTTPVDVSKTQATARRISGAVNNLDGERIKKADAEPQNWLAHGRTYGEQRYSPLDKVNAENVKDLGLAWTYETDTIRGLEASPIVVDGVMFATGSWSKVYALDGCSVEYADWHFNVRGSNTEPMLRLNLEATTQELMEEKRDEVLSFIRS